MPPLTSAAATAPYRPWLLRHGEPAAFWVLSLLHLLPVWAFHYLPTQDGPAHLANAVILRNYGSSADYERFFELRLEPLPNLSAQVLLAALMHVFSPLVAEKLLVSLYILGFAASFRYFLGAFHAACRPLSWGGLLFLYNRCFWMGFYNYCLSLALLWLILGYCLRRRAEFHVPHAAILMFLFMAAYFTHLVGFLLALGAAALSAVLVPPRRVLRLTLVILAGLPALCLTLDYFDRTGFLQAPSAMRLVHLPLARLWGEPVPTSLGQELTALDGDLFEHQAGPAVPFTLLLLPYFTLLTVLTLVEGHQRLEPGRPNWHFPALFGVGVLGLYVLIPNHLGFEHGGFTKVRLAPLLPLLWLACLREPIGACRRGIARALIVLLLAVNLILVTRTIQASNRALQEYTAGVEALGGGHRLFVSQRENHPSPLVDPLLHAADYYCLAGENINLDNYQASTPHFPIKYRAGRQRARGSWARYPGQEEIDVILCWQMPPVHRAGWTETFHKGPLRIYGRSELRPLP